MRLRRANGGGELDPKVCKTCGMKLACRAAGGRLTIMVIDQSFDEEHCKSAQSLATRIHMEGALYAEK